MAATARRHAAFTLSEFFLMVSGGVRILLMFAICMGSILEVEMHRCFFAIVFF